MAKAKPGSESEPTIPESPAAPVHVPDAGAVFQQDRSGSPRGRELTEGAANFASFSQTLTEGA